jgi:ubiquinone/menaquinone biosynthesis C-methylase UbiE
MSLDDRVFREKEFHEHIYKSHGRQNLTGFYPLSSNVRRQYTNILFDHCGNKKILEYGCGLGSYGFLLASQGAKVTGIDISEYAINTARKQAKTEKIEIDFRLMNAEHLDLSDESYDIICGTGILHHLNLQNAIHEIRRVLKRDGKAIFIEPLGHNILINLYRMLTPGLRSKDEHPMKMSDLRKLGETFQKHSAIHYYLFGLFALPLSKSNIYPKLTNLLDQIDKKIFNYIPYFKKYSWQVLIILEK